MTDTVIVDGESRRIAVGTRVECGGLCTVTAISDPDGDVVDGEEVAIVPTVTVLGDDGVDDTFPCLGPAWDSSIAEVVYRCDDLEVVEPDA